MDASEDEFLPGNASLLEIPVGMAPETDVLVLSPADMALRLLQQRLPTRQAARLMVRTKSRQISTRHVC